MKKNLRILICDDDPIVHKTLTSRLSFVDGVTITSVYQPDEALEVYEKQCFDLVFLDLHYSNSKKDGFAVLSKIKKIDPASFVVVNSSSRDFNDILKAVRLGANDYFPKSGSANEAQLFLGRILEQQHRASLESRAKHRRESELSSLDRMIGSSPLITELKKKVKKFSQQEDCILIVGPTGSGKELVAKAIHELSSELLAPFVAVDCGAVPASTADDFFFGHEKGAFTGAEGPAEGIFEQANQGTLFLDEVNSLSAEMQNKLLRVLQEKEVRRLGSKRVRSVNFRLIAAANQDLAELVKAGKFRQDLFYRLHVLVVVVPALEARKSDIPDLVQHFLPVRKISEELFGLMRNYSWPGNIRELKNFLIALNANSPDEEVLTPEHIPDYFLERMLSSDEPGDRRSLSVVEETYEGFRRSQVERERAFFQKSYRMSKGNVSQLARKLGLDRSYLFEKLVSYKIHLPKK